MKDFMHMREIWNSNLPRLTNIERGNGMLTCAHRSVDENEEAMRLDNLADRTEGKRSVEEELRTGRKGTTTSMRAYSLTMR